MSTALCWTLVALSLALPAQAQGPLRDPADHIASNSSDELATLFGDEETVSIATGTQKPVRLAPSVASIITAKQLRERGITNLDDALAMVPGMYVGLSPMNRLNPNWTIRGITTDQTPQVLLLRDGVPITHYYTGSRPNLFHLPVENIERIEVIRGPGSAIYGADAFAGVVNVITRPVDGASGLQAGIGAGSVEQGDAWMRYGTSLSDWKMAVNFEYAQLGNDNERRVGADLQSAFDSNFSRAPGPLSTAYKVVDAGLKLSRGPLDLSLWHWRLMEAGVGAGAAQALDPTGRQDIDLTQLDGHYRFRDLPEGWRSELHFSYRALNDHPRFVIFPAGATLPVGTDGNIGSSPFGGLVTFSAGVLGQPSISDRFAMLELTTYSTAWTNHQLRTSLGIKQEQESTRELKNFGPGILDGSEGSVDGTLTDISHTANVFMPDQRRTVSYLSVQDEWSLAPDWQLTGGLRYDHYSDFGDTFNPRLALVWAARHDLTSKLMLGRAFRAPSFGEQHVRNNPVVLGNPDLRPETIDSYELAFDYRPSQHFTGKLNLFRYQIRDLIDYVADSSGTTSTAQNAQDRQGHGLEIELDWKPAPAWKYQVSYAWQTSEDRQTGQPIANTPGQMAGLGIEWQAAPGWTTGLSSQWIAELKRDVADPRAPVKNYLLTHLHLRHAPEGTHWAWSARISNLFDQNARAPTLYNPSLGNAAIADDYPLPGRGIYLELRYQ